MLVRIISRLPQFIVWKYCGKLAAVFEHTRTCSKWLYSKSIYNIEKKANVVGVGTDIKFKIFSGNSVCGPPPPPLNHSIG
jgi:hypothetical protein